MLIPNPTSNGLPPLRCRCRCQYPRRNNSRSLSLHPVCNSSLPPFSPPSTEQFPPSAPHPLTISSISKVFNLPNSRPIHHPLYLCLALSTSPSPSRVLRHLLQGTTYHPLLQLVLSMHHAPLRPRVRPLSHHVFRSVRSFNSPLTVNPLQHPHRILCHVSDHSGCKRLPMSAAKGGKEGGFIDGQSDYGCQCGTRTMEMGFWVLGVGSWVWGLGFGVWGLGRRFTRVKFCPSSLLHQKTCSSQ